MKCANNPFTKLLSNISINILNLNSSSTVLVKEIENEFEDIVGHFLNSAPFVIVSEQYETAQEQIF